jgi:hypothetical protein
LKHINGLKFCCGLIVFSNYQYISLLTEMLRQWLFWSKPIYYLSVLFVLLFGVFPTIYPDMLQIQIELHCKDSDQWVRVVEIYHQGKLFPDKSCLRNLIRRWKQGGFDKRLCDVPFLGSRCFITFTLEIDNISKYLK